MAGSAKKKKVISQRTIKGTSARITIPPSTEEITIEVDRAPKKLGSTMLKVTGAKVHIEQGRKTK